MCVCVYLLFSYCLVFPYCFLYCLFCYSVDLIFFYRLFYVVKGSVMRPLFCSIYINLLYLFIYFLLGYIGALYYSIYLFIWCVSICVCIYLVLMYKKQDMVIHFCLSKSHVIKLSSFKFMNIFDWYVLFFIILILVFCSIVSSYLIFLRLIFSLLDFLFW